MTWAKTIISGGRALGSSEKFQEVILPLANKLGASRAALHAGYAPHGWHVGQTGRSLHPISKSPPAFPGRSSTSPA